MRIAISDSLSVSFNKDIMLNLLISVVWASMLLTYAKGVFNHLPVLKDIADEAVYALVVLPTVLALPSLVNRFCLADYLFFLLLVFYYLSAYIFYPEDANYLSDNVFTCLCCVFPFYFIGRLVDISQWFDAFVLLSTVCIFMDLFYFLVYAQNHKVMADVAGEDNMWAAYQALPHVTMLLWTTLEKFRIWKAATFLAGVLFLLSCGTRGPLVCLGFFGIIYFFFYMNFRGAIYVKIGILMSIALFIVFLQDIIYHLAKVFTNLQLSTRILEKFISGEIGNDTYRSVLRDKLYNVMENSEHFWGLGPFGTGNYGIIYPHYLPLDFICTFGYLVGIVLLIILVMVIVGGLYVTRGAKAQVFLVFLCSVSIVKLMLSNSFILEPYFFFLLGACAKVLLESNETLKTAG